MSNKREYKLSYFVFLFMLPLPITCVILSANGVNLPNARRIQSVASLGPRVVVIRCDKEQTKYGNSNYWVLMQSVESNRRVATRIDSETSQIPEAGEMWIVDTSGWDVVFKERIYAQ